MVCGTISDGIEFNSEMCDPLQVVVESTPRMVGEPPGRIGLTAPVYLLISGIPAGSPVTG